MKFTSLALATLSATTLCGVLALPAIAATDDTTATPPPRHGGPAQLPKGRQGPAAMLRGDVARGIDRLDTNDDGKISKDEFLAPRLERINTLLNRFDSNGDGLLSQDELQPKAQTAKGKPAQGRGAGPAREDRPRGPLPAQGRGRPAVDQAALAACLAKADPDFVPPEKPAHETLAERFADADKNADGKLSLAELTAEATAKADTQFARLDRDGDGYLTAADRDAARAERQAKAEAVRACMKTR